MRLDGPKTYPISNKSTQKMKKIQSPQLTKKKRVSKIKPIGSDCISINPADSKNDIALVFENHVEPGKVTMTLPIRTVSEANNFDPWTKKHKRHKSQKRTVFFAMINLKRYITLPCTITFIRYAPKSLDRHDNLPISMKYICDQVCAEITQEHRPGLADNFQDINIKYDQIISKTYAVKIIIEF